jgi:prevent-host-death family protein
MKDVGVRELKAKLSSYLEEVDKGTSIRITDRGKPKAMIVPIEQPKESVLDRGVREGWLSVGPNFGKPDKGPPQRFHSRPGVRLQDVLDEDRGR